MASLILDTPKNRAQAHLWVDKAPSTTKIDFADLAKVRSREQNDRLWALLTLCQNFVRYEPTAGYGLFENGMKFSKDDWKTYFCHSLAPRS